MTNALKLTTPCCNVNFYTDTASSGYYGHEEVVGYSCTRIDCFNSWNTSGELVETRIWTDEVLYTEDNGDKVYKWEHGPVDELKERFPEAWAKFEASNQ